MTKFPFAMIVVGGLILLGSQIAPQAEEQSAPGEGSKMLKMVMHVNFADAEQQKGGLRNLTNILKAVDDSKIEVVCHGPGIGLVVDGQSKHADDVAKLLKQGVQFVACENTLREKSISKDKLLPGVATVPSGAVEVIQKQQHGFGYFKP